MRRVLTALALVGLLAVPGFGAINIALSSGGSNSTLVSPSQTFTIDILAGATDGLYSLAGNTVASGPDTLTTVPGSLVWMPSFRITWPIVPEPIPTPGPNGTYKDLYSARTDALTNPDGGWVVLAKVASYQVQVNAAAAAGNQVVLSFAPADYGGWGTSDDIGSTAIGAISPLTVTVIPEPTTLGLLALGGLLIARRRRV